MKNHRQRVRVAVAQHAAQPGEADRNAELAIELAASAAGMGATFVLLPEMNITGYEVALDWRALAIGADHPALARVAQAAVAHRIAIAAGFIERWERGFSICHTVFRADGTQAFQRKAGGPGATADGCVGDPTRTQVSVGRLRIGFIICADGGDETLWQQAVAGGANLIAWPSAGYDQWTRLAGGADEQVVATVAANGAAARRNAQARAQALQLPLLLSNPIGPTSHAAWPGNSGIIDGKGAVRAWLPEEAVVERMQPGVVVADVEVVE